MPGTPVQTILQTWTPAGARNRHLEARRLDKDRIEGSAKVVKVKVETAVGKIIGDAKLVAEGHAEQDEGTLQNAIGGIKDTIQGN